MVDLLTYSKLTSWIKPKKKAGKTNAKTAWSGCRCGGSGGMQLMIISLASRRCISLKLLGHSGEDAFRGYWIMPGRENLQLICRPAWNYGGLSMGFRLSP